MSTTARVLLWMLAMLLVPPLVGFGAAASSSWTQNGMVVGLVVYGVLMVAMATGAALQVAGSVGARIGLFLAFAIGMMILQLTVFFVGCSILLATQ